MAKSKKTKKRRKPQKTKKTKRRKRSRKSGFPRLDVAQAAQVGGSLILGEVIGERVDVGWVSDTAIGFTILAFFTREETKKKTYLAAAVGAQIKEVADQAGLTAQVKGLIPGDNAALTA